MNIDGCNLKRPGARRASAPSVQSAVTTQSDTTFSPARQWYLVFALVTISIVAALDNSIPVLLAQEIKQDLAVSDTELGVLLGSSFALFYTLTSIPMGWLIDRYNRKRLVQMGIVFWSVSTMLCGLSSTFWQFFMGRAGVGFGEGGLAPANFSLVRDAVSPDRRGRAFSLIFMASGLGTGVAFGIAGLIYMLAESHAAMNVPGVGSLRPWQLAMLMVGLLGLPSFLLLVPVREPARQSVATGHLSYAETFRLLRVDWRLYLPLILFTSGLTMLASSFATWSGAMAQRSYGITVGEVAQGLAICTILFPLFGYLGIGAILDRLTKRGRPRAGVPIGIFAALLLIGLSVQTALAPTPTIFWMSLAVTLVFISAATPIAHTLLATLVPSEASGKIIVLFGLVPTLVARTGAPVVVGRLSDTVFRGAGDTSLSLAIAATASLSAIVSLVAMMWLAVEWRHRSKL